MAQVIFSFHVFYVISSFSTDTQKAEELSCSNLRDEVFCHKSAQNLSCGSLGQRISNENLFGDFEGCKILLAVS